MAYNPTVEQARNHMKAQVRNDVRFKLGRVAQAIIDQQIEKVLVQFDAAVQRGEMLDFAPKAFTLRDLSENVALLTERTVARES